MSHTSDGLVPDARRIGVLRANSLGDYLFLGPALDALRAAYPAAEIVLLGAPWHARALAGRPGPPDRVVVVPPRPGIRERQADEPAPPDALLAAARAERFDVLVQAHGGGGNSNPLVREIGARVTAGLRADGAPALDRWVRYQHYQPEVFRYLEAVRLVGAAPVTVEPRFPVTAEDRAEATGVAGEPARPRVALHPGANDPRRRWPPDRFAAVGDTVAGAGFDVVVTGTAAERDLAAAVRATMRHPARDLSGRLSLGGLAALLAGCALVVANDTGPLHLAAAVGTPTVGVYWIGNLVNCAPAIRARHRPIASWTVHCPVCGADGTPDLYPARGGRRCDHRVSFVADVPVVEVVAAVRDLLAEGAGNAFSAGRGR